MVSKSARRRSKDSACSVDSTQIGRIKRTDERTRTAGPLITSALSIGAKRCRGLHVPHGQDCLEITARLVRLGLKALLPLRRVPAAAPVLGVAAWWSFPPPRPARRASGARGPGLGRWWGHRFGGFGGAAARGRLLRGAPTPTFAGVPYLRPQPYTSRLSPATDS